LGRNRHGVKVIAVGLLMLRHVVGRTTQILHCHRYHRQGVGPGVVPDIHGPQIADKVPARLMPARVSSLGRYRQAIAVHAAIAKRNCIRSIADGRTAVYRIGVGAIVHHPHRSVVLGAGRGEEIVEGIELAGTLMMEAAIASIEPLSSRPRVNGDAVVVNLDIPRATGMCRTVRGHQTVG